MSSIFGHAMRANITRNHLPNYSRAFQTLGMSALHPENKFEILRDSSHFAQATVFRHTY